MSQISKTRRFRNFSHFSLILDPILASFLNHFGINFRHFFGIDFWMPFWDAIFLIFGRKWLPNCPSVRYPAPHKICIFRYHFRKPFLGCILVAPCLTFGSLSAPVGSLWARFGSLLVRFWLASVANICRFLASDRFAFIGWCPRGAAVTLRVCNTFCMPFSGIDFAMFLDRLFM